MHLFKALFGQSKKKTDNLTPSRARINRIILYTSIAFFVITVIFVSFTYYGRWQAGLIEVGSSAFLFVIFLHILKIIIPQSSGKIITKPATPASAPDSAKIKSKIKRIKTKIPPLGSRGFD